LALINQLLNLIGVVLWMSWRTAIAPTQAAGAGTLVSTLKPAESRRPGRWTYPVALLALLALRPLLYAPLARMLDWTPTLSLGPVTLAFHGDALVKLFWFSLLSFAWSLITFQTGIMLLVLLGPREPDSTGHTRWLRELAGRTASLPKAIMLGLPVALLAGVWEAVVFPLAGIGILPPPPPAHAIAVQALVVGFSVWLPVRWLVVGLLLLRFINDYVYLGEHRLWDYVRAAAGRLLQPLRWLPARIGKLDFAPLLAAVVVLGFAWAMEMTLARSYAAFSR
jgi:uncharacterized protein YggT (Ycf19 family)